MAGANGCYWPSCAGQRQCFILICQPHTHLSYVHVSGVILTKHMLGQDWQMTDCSRNRGRPNSTLLVAPQPLYLAALFDVQTHISFKRTSRSNAHLVQMHISFKRTSAARGLNHPDMKEPAVLFLACSTSASSACQSIGFNPKCGGTQRPPC